MRWGRICWADVLNRTLREGFINKDVFEEEYHISGREEKYSKQRNNKEWESLSLFHQEGCYSGGKGEVLGHWFLQKEFLEACDSEEKALVVRIE